MLLGNKLSKFDNNLSCCFNNNNYLSIPRGYFIQITVILGTLFVHCSEQRGGHISKVSSSTLGIYQDILGCLLYRDYPLFKRVHYHRFHCIILVSPILDNQTRPSITLHPVFEFPTQLCNIVTCLYSKAENLHYLALCACLYYILLYYCNFSHCYIHWQAVQYLQFCSVQCGSAPLSITQHIFV